MTRPLRLLVMMFLAVVVPVLAGPAVRAQDAADGDDADARATAPHTVFDGEPWFVKVTGRHGIAGYHARRTKWLDVNGDGWLDILLMSNDGADWQRRFLVANGYEFGKLPDDGATAVARDDWPGDKAAFDRVDLDADGSLTGDEFRLAARRHLFSLLVSTPGENGNRVFVDRTAESGLHCNRPYHLAIAGDVDNDGDVDLFCTGYATQNPGTEIETPAFVFLNDGSGVFTPYDQPADRKGPNAYPATVCGATFVDVNLDGTLDLFTGCWYSKWGNMQLYEAYPDRLYLGRGKGVFEDVTRAANMMTVESILDTLPAEDREARRVRPETRHLVGRGSHKPTYGTGAADIDNDGDIDLFTMSYGRQWNHQWQNRGIRFHRDGPRSPWRPQDPVFREIGEQTRFDGDDDESGEYPAEFHPDGRRAELPFRSNGNSFDVSFGDYNNDGWLDCVVSEYTHAWAGSSSDITRVLTNTGPAGDFQWHRGPVKIERVHTARNWNQGDFCTAWCDVDNDGWLDLIISSCVYPDRNVLEIHRQVPHTGQFERITDEIKLRWPDSTQVSLGDFDRDGDVDLLVGNQPHESHPDIRADVAVFRNDIANRTGHHFLSLRLAGTDSNRMAIGARVRLTAGGVTQTREITAGRGHVGHQDDVRLVFGLGKATRVDRLEITWPIVRPDADGHPTRPTQVFTDLPVDRFLKVVEGADEPETDDPR